MALPVGVHHFTVDEFLRIRDLPERTELIEGVIYDVSPEGIRHMEAVERLRAALALAFPSLRVFTGGSVRVTADFCPIPDVAVYRSIRPAPGETDVCDGRQLVVVVEVAVSTVARDVGEKLAGYAEGLVPHYLVVVPHEGYMIWHADPAGSSYATSQRLEYPGLDLEATLGALVAE